VSLVQEQQYAVSVTVAGRPLPGLFDKFDGGEIDSDSTTYSAGGMASPEALPGPVTTGEVTVGRAFRGERDASLKKWLNTQVGQAIVIGKQALNPDKSPVPDGLETFRGIMKGVSTPTHDSNGSAVSTFEITATISGLPS
jgi:hypothetical protein